MNWYKNEGMLWHDVIEAVSQEIKRNTLMIEKDIIQSFFLEQLSHFDIPLVFKGGTSLSKAYCIIDRFSEDIDLSAERKLTDSEKRRTKEEIIEISKSLGLILKNADSIASRHDYNKYVFEYTSLFMDIKPEIIIETSFYQAAFPVKKMPIHSFIGDLCSERNIKLPVSFITVFNFPVQSIERTFIDKIFAVCDYRIENMMERDSRHLYDIAKMYPLICFDDTFKSLIIEVRESRMKSKNNPSADLKYDITQMLTEIITSRFYERDYRNITEKLLYEKYDYSLAIKNGIEEVIKKNIF